MGRVAPFCASRGGPCIGGAVPDGRACGGAAGAGRGLCETGACGCGLGVWATAGAGGAGVGLGAGGAVPAAGSRSSICTHNALASSLACGSGIGWRPSSYSVSTREGMLARAANCPTVRPFLSLMLLSMFIYCLLLESCVAKRQALGIV